MSNRVAIIAGGSSGIGRSTVENLACHFEIVALLDKKKPLDDLPHNAKFFQLDLTNSQEVNECISAIKAEFGRVDVLVNCCGIAHRKTIIDTTPDEWDHVMTVNLKTAFLTSKSVIKLMIKQRCGSIINIGSGWGLAGGDRASAYCASKGGIVQLTRAMAVDFGQYNIRVNCVCPGDVETPLLAEEASLIGTSIDDMTAAAKSRPLGRVGQPADVAAVISFLASKSSSYMTGSVLVVDGGSLAGSA